MAFQGYATVDARLAERYPSLPDVAGFARRYQRSLTLDVFARDPDPRPLAYGEFDHGQAAVTESLSTQGVWEAQESTIAVDILANTPGAVLDFGASIGWYTVLAGLFGNHPVIAYEPDRHAVEALKTNAERYGVDLTRRGGVSPRTRPVTVDGEVALMKCDIEGAEHHAVNACADLFREHRIRYALIEVSPVFTADGRSDCDYVALVGRLQDWGYRVYRVPPKGWEHNDPYRERPLATLKRHRELGDDWAEVVAGCRQDNFVLICQEDA